MIRLVLYLAALSLFVLGWTKTGAIEANGVCDGGDKIYIVGRAGPYGVVQARYKKDGSLADSRFDAAAQSYLGCVFVNDRLYVISGARNIVVYEKNLEEVARIRLEFSPQSVTSDGRYIYVGGFSVVGAGDTEWRVAKLDADLNVVATYRSNPTPHGDIVYQVAVNPVTGELWVLGDVNVRNVPIGQWRIEMLDKNLRLIRVAEPHAAIFQPPVVFDEEGNAYTKAGPTRYGADVDIVKLNRIGNLVKSGGPPHVLAMAYAGGRLYALTQSDRLYLEVYSKDLDLVDKMAVGDQLGQVDGAYLHHDGSDIYVVVNLAGPTPQYIIFRVSPPRRQPAAPEISTQQTPEEQPPAISTEAVATAVAATAAVAGVGYAVAKTLAAKTTLSTASSQTPGGESTSEKPTGEEEKTEEKTEEKKDFDIKRPRVAYLELPTGHAIFIKGLEKIFTRDDFVHLVPSHASQISTPHFKIYYTGEKWYIEDLGSEKGTYVNGEDIREKGPIELKNGAEISPAGVIRLIFRTL